MNKSSPNNFLAGMGERNSTLVFVDPSGSPAGLRPGASTEWDAERNRLDPWLDP